MATPSAADFFVDAIKQLPAPGNRTTEQRIQYDLLQGFALMAATQTRIRSDIDDLERKIGGLERDIRRLG